MESVKQVDVIKRLEKLEEEKKELENSLVLFKKIYKTATDPMLLIDKNSKIVDANPASFLFFQLPREELLKKTINDFILLDGDETIKNHQEILIKNGTLLDEVSLSVIDGTVKNVVIHVIGNIRNNVDLYILKDISPIRNLEYERAMHLQMFNNIFSQVIDGLVLFDETGTIINANPAFCSVVNLEKEKLIGRKFHSLVPKIYEGEFHEFIEALKLNGSFFGEIRLKVGNTFKVFEMSTSSNVYNNLYMSIMRDITDKKEMEQKVSDSEIKFQQIFDESLEGMIIWEDFDENTNHQFPIQIIQINQAAKSILALQDSNDMQDYVRQLSKLKIINKNKYINLIAGMKRLTELNQDDYIYEIQFLDDSKKSVEISTKFNIIPNIHFTIFRDVTERLKMEDQLRKSDMLNVIGELAAGVAHEIRNPLTSLKGFIQLLKGNVDGYSMYFNIIMAELDRIDSIVNEFLVLAKPQVVQYKHFNIVKIMQETIELLYPQAMMDNIQFQTNFEDLYLFSYCEPNQIKQVFINIVKNAIEVSKKGGNIYISLRIVDDRFIKISITDEGEGISEDKLKRLGQPFYTTKERGTGLGLMVSYKIIKEHGGRIEVESELGKGTTFHVFLPKK